MGLLMHSTFSVVDWKYDEVFAFGTKKLINKVSLVYLNFKGFLTSSALLAKIKQLSALTCLNKIQIKSGPEALQRYPGTFGP